MLESGPTCSLVAKLPQRSSLVVREFCAAGEEWCEQAYGHVCETLMPDVVAPEAHQSDRSYVRELSGPTFDSLLKNLARWAVTRRTSKTNIELSKLGVGACVGIDTSLGQYGNYKS